MGEKGREWIGVGKRDGGCVVVVNNSVWGWDRRGDGRDEGLIQRWSGWIEMVEDMDG